jgi:nicotinate-nucleotide adenylyltransferase
MIGVLGGTFDPPHLAHLILAEEARYQLNLEKVMWVLTPISPLKPEIKISPSEQRLELLEAAVKDNPYFEISRVDIGRPAPHYAYETLQLLAEVYSKDNLVYLMGGDSLNDLPRWKKPKELINNCHSIAVMHRPGDEIDLKKLEAEIPNISGRIQWVAAPLVDISSTEIRKRLRRSEPVRYFMLNDVYQIIRNKKYYR